MPWVGPRLAVSRVRRPARAAGGQEAGEPKRGEKKGRGKEAEDGAQDKEMTKKRSQVRKDDVERKTEKKAAVTDKGTATSAEAQSLESEQTTGLGDSDSEPTVPWDLGKTTEVMLLWLFAFFTLRSCIWRIGMWLLRISSEAQLTASGLAGFTLSLDLSMLVATMFILKQSLREYRPLRERGLFPLHFRGRWWVYVLLSCLFIPMVDWLGTRIMVAFPNEMDGLPSTTEVQLAKGHTMTNVLYFILLSLCAPLWEETMFRGFLIPSLSRYLSKHMAVVASSSVFAMAHGSLRQFIPLLILGIVIGNAFVSSRNLLPSIVLHSLYNSYVFVHVLMGS